jgi:hypothetical protein
MENLWFHLLVIPGIFLLGRLSGSVKIARFKVKVVSTREKERFFSR